MALLKSKEVPKDAVVMDEMEATAYVWDMVSNWKSLSDTWALRYSPVVLGGINAVSAMVINRHYRHKLKLGTYGYISSVLPITAMPALLTTLFHRHLVSTQVLLMKDNSCPICYELRAITLQCSLGILYPLVLAPTSALMFANRYATYRVPNIVEGRVWFKFVKNISKSLSGTLVFLTTIQFLAASVLTYFEMRNHYIMRSKIMEAEQKVIAEYGLE